MMKKLSILFLVALLSANLHAQEVYQAVVEQAQKVVMGNARPEDAKFQLAQFKLSSMRYLYNTLARQGKVDATVLDYQAYNMSIFLTAMYGELKREPFEAGKKRILQKYITASRHHAMFLDPDKSITEAYATDPNCITPFSLNTNWQKAAEELKLK